jgi:hypothetical protein
MRIPPSSGQVASIAMKLKLLACSWKVQGQYFGLSRTPATY